MLRNALSLSSFSPTVDMSHIEKYVTAAITNTRIAPKTTPMCTSANGMLSTPEPTIVLSRLMVLDSTVACLRSRGCTSTVSPVQSSCVR